MVKSATETQLFSTLLYLCKNTHFMVICFTYLMKEKFINKAKHFILVHETYDTLYFE